MDATKRLTGKTYRHFMHDSLRRSSSFLLISAAVGAIFSFGFWLICAHLTSSRQIGYAVTLTAYVSLISTIATLGLTNAVIRFLPNHKDKDTYFSTVLAITLISSAAIGALLITSIRYLSPKLGFAIANPEIFGLLLFIAVISSVGSIADASLLAQKDTKNILIKALWSHPLRILLPFVFIDLKLVSILVIYAITLFIGTAFEFYILYKHHHKRRSIDLSSLFNTYQFTAGNFAGTIFGVLPATLVPAIVLNRLGPSLAAYFYIAMQFSSFLSLICSSSAQAFLSEASNDKDAGAYMHHLVKAFKNLYSLLIPAALLMALIGTQILRFYGYDYYSHGAILLILLCISSLFIGINWLGDSLLNVQKRPFAYGAMNAINAIFVVVMVYAFANRGLTAIGFVWLFTQIVVVIIYLILQRKFIRTYKPITS